MWKVCRKHVSVLDCKLFKFGGIVQVSRSDFLRPLKLHIGELTRLKSLGTLHFVIVGADASSVGQALLARGVTGDSCQPVCQDAGRTFFRLPGRN